MWPQMIDMMFWPFAFKAAAERHNQLSLTASGQMPLSILHNVPIKNIPVKTFHTLFCPVYVLDSQAQSAGDPGPPKWEPHSCIGVYLGHSPFHAGSLALVFNPRTGGCPHNIILFLTILFQPSLTWMQAWFPLTGRTCSSIHPRRQQMRNFLLLKTGWI